MKRAILHAPRNLKVDEGSTPKISKDEVLVEVKATGICITDVNAYEGLYKDVEYPVVLGHEISGEVAEVGTNVKQIQVSDRVVVNPGIACGKCYFCLRDQTNLCRNISRMGFERRGGYAEYTAVPSNNVMKIPDNISFEGGALVQTLAVVVRALWRSNVKEQDTVAVAGAGPIGLLTLQAAKAMGATQVVVTGGGNRPKRLELARSLGADYTIDTSREDPVSKVKNLSKGIGMDIAFEASGSPRAFNQCLEMVRDGGTILTVGILTKPLERFDVYSLYFRELTIIGTRGSAGAWEAAIRLMAEGKVDVKPLITHSLRLDELEEGFRLLRTKSKDVIKVVIKP